MREEVTKSRHWVTGGRHLNEGMIIIPQEVSRDRSSHSPNSPSNLGIKTEISGYVAFLERIKQLQEQRDLRGNRA